MSRRFQAHPEGERDWYPVVMVILMGVIILTVVIFGVPGGLPE